MRRRIALLFFAFTAVQAFAAEYPAKPVRIITPFPPGGSVDLVARVLAIDLGKPLGQQIVVDNRSGASGNIGTELAKNAVPDGYTLLVNTLPFVTNQFVYEKMPYDPINDFAPISLLSTVAAVLVSHPALPVNSVKDLIALARSKPNAITYATAGAATNPHIAGELLNNLAKIKLFAVHYKGGGPGMISTLSGETQLHFVNAITEALPHIQAKKLKPLGITSLKRSVLMPEVATVAESGLPGFEVEQLYGVLAPAGTPREIVRRLNEETAKVMQAADIKSRLLADGSEVSVSSPEDFEKRIVAEIDKWTKVIKQAGIKED